MIIVIVMIVFYNYLLPQLFLDQYGDKMFCTKKSTCEKKKKMCVEVREETKKRENKNTECTQL